MLELPVDRLAAALSQRPPQTGRRHLKGTAFCAAPSPRLRLLIWKPEAVA